MGLDFSSTLEDAIQPDTKDEPQGKSRAVREFEAICAKHNLSCGSPEDLIPFERALDGNKLLAMNFWSVVARLGDSKDGQPLGQQEILDAIVRGVTGQPIEQAIQVQSPAIDQLSRLLAGEDVTLASAPVTPPPNEALSPNQYPNEEKDQPLSPVENTPETSTSLPPERAAYSAPAAPPTPVATSPSAPDRASPPDPLSPIERLSDIGPRSRLVLRPEHDESVSLGPMTRATAQPAPLREAARNSTAADFPAGNPALVDSERLEPMPSDDRVADTNQEPRLSIPLAAYAAHDEDGRTGRRAGGILIALVIAAGLAFLIAQGVTAWRQPDNSARTGVAAFGQSATSVFSRFAASVHAGIASAQEAWSGRTAAAHSSASPPPPQSTITPPAKEPPAPPNSSRPTTTPRPQTSETPSPGSSMAGSRRPDTANVEDSYSSAGDARDSTLPQVSGDEMKDHLISSRFPIVPDTANANAVRGVVTLEAVVTARGTVEHIRAISGPENLRQPAIEAVSGWRYRPYLAEGTPTDVRTTIRVDFSGND